MYDKPVKNRIVREMPSNDFTIDWQNKVLDGPYFKKPKKRNWYKVFLWLLSIVFIVLLYWWGKQ
jgi:hypothetical protein